MYSHVGGRRSWLCELSLVGTEGRKETPGRNEKGSHLWEGKISVMHLLLCYSLDDELPLKRGEMTTSPPCQFGKPQPNDARMCCIMLPWQLTSYNTRAGIRGVMPHESSELSVTGRDKEQRYAPDLLGLDLFVFQEFRSEKPPMVK